MRTGQSPSEPTLRLVPGQPLPPYSYVSGKFPHPLRDPQGHSYGMKEPAFSIRKPDEWRECEPYLWGIDLFNHGYYWEAHETWEAVWHAVGRRGAIADFCKALIKLAAAGVKAREGRENGVKRHAQRAKQLLESVAAQVGIAAQTFMGLSLAKLTQSAEQLIGDPAAVVNTSDEPVVIAMPFVLRIQGVGQAVPDD